MELAVGNVVSLTRQNELSLAEIRDNSAVTRRRCDDNNSDILKRLLNGEIKCNHA